LNEVVEARSKLMTGGNPMWQPLNWLNVVIPPSLAFKSAKDD